MLGFLGRHWLLLSVLVLFIGGGSYFAYGQINKTKGKPFTIKKVDLTDSLSFSGQVDAKEKASIVFQTSGAKVAFISVKEGDTVKKGQWLAGLDMGDLDRAVTAARYDYIAADAHAKYIEDTVKNNDTTESFLQKDTRVAAQTDRDKKYDAWLAALRNRVNGILKSPINGVVYTVPNIEPGSIFYLPSSTEFDVVNPNTVFFSANADQTDVVRISEGQDAEIVFDSYPDKQVKSKVESIAFTPSTNETGTVYEVKLTLPKDNSDYRLRMGMTGDVNFVLKEYKGVIAIAPKYIKTVGGVSSVAKQVGNHIVATPVTTGQTIEGLTEITSGLSEGDVIYDQTK